MSLNVKGGLAAVSRIGSVQRFGRSGRQFVGSGPPGVLVAGRVPARCAGHRGDQSVVELASDPPGLLVGKNLKRKERQLAPGTLTRIRQTLASLALREAMSAS